MICYNLWIKIKTCSHAVITEIATKKKKSYGVCSVATCDGETLDIFNSKSEIRFSNFEKLN